MSKSQKNIATMSLEEIQGNIRTYRVKLLTVRLASTRRALIRIHTELVEELQTRLLEIA